MRVSVWIRAASIGAMALLVATVLSLDAFGKSRRVVEPPVPVASGRVPVVRVASAEEAYRAWRARGLHGRIVVSFSSRLHFVPVERRTPPRSPSGAPLDPADVFEQALDPTNFLWVAMEKGIARDLRHVLPDRVYAEKRLSLPTEPGAREVDGELLVPEFGSPRLLTTLPRVVDLEEPPLVFVSASFFQERSAAEVHRALSVAHPTADLVVLCESRDDPEVTPAEREQLAVLASLLGAR